MAGSVTLRVDELVSRFDRPALCEGPEHGPEDVGPLSDFHPRPEVQSVPHHVGGKLGTGAGLDRLFDGQPCGMCCGGRDLGDALVPELFARQGQVQLRTHASVST